MTSEQEVRTRAGWIGVEISRSRVRTPGRAGYGLYRVRGSLPVQWSISRGDTEIDRSPGQSQATLWTAYAFTLDEVGRAVTASIECGTPAGPHELCLSDGTQGAHVVTHRAPTRWTSAYRGKRNLGEREGPTMGELAQRAVDRGFPVVDTGGTTGHGLMAPGIVDAGLERDLAELERTDLAVASAAARLRETTQDIVRRAGLTDPRQDGKTVRQRQREFNAEFQAVHAVAREHGLRKRHAAKLARNADT